MKSFFKRYWFVLLIILVLFGFGFIRLFSALGSHQGASSIQVLGRNNFSQIGGNDKTSLKTGLVPILLNQEAAKHRFISVKAGLFFTALLTTEGSVYVMGNNSTHAVSASSIGAFAEPMPIKFPELGSNEKITQIDASRDHIVALTNQGRVYTWGSNYTAQLGDGTNDSKGVPKLVDGLPKIIQVAAGYRHSAAITESGEVYAWGGVCKPDAMSKAQEMIAQAAANITKLGGYFAEGADLPSEDPIDCGTVPTTFVQSTTPKKLSGLEGKAEQISVGYGHILVLNERGEVYSAGCNTYKQLGRTKATGNNKNDLAIVKLSRKVTQISAGYRHSAVITDDSRVWLWGYSFNNALRVGQPQNDFIQTPAALKTDNKFKTIEASHDNTFAITDKNEVLGWGNNDFKAFWQKQETFALTKIGEVHGEWGSLSAGMEHLLLAEGR